MSAQPPPLSLAYLVDRAAPGIYGAFFTRVLHAVDDTTRATSWYRGAAHNQRVGGQPDSQHRLGLALDLQADDLAALHQRLTRSGLVATLHERHVHVQAWPAGTARRIGLLAALGI